MSKVVSGIRTLEEARDYVLRVRICGLFSDGKGTMASLWDAVDLPHRQPGQKGWGEKVNSIWMWKNELPLQWPDEIYYGKTRGGLAVLMSVDYLRKEQIPKFRRPIRDCSPLAQRLHAVLRNDPMTTAQLRERLDMTQRPERNRFDRALQELQITLNIVRQHAPSSETDAWVLFREQYSF